MNLCPHIAALLFAPSLALSQDLRVDVGWIPAGSGEAPDGTGGQFFLADAATDSPVGWAFCVSPSLPSTGDGSTMDYDFGGSIAEAFRLQNTPETGFGALLWLMDNYLQSHVLDTASAPNRYDLHQAFDNTFNEILQDWNGSYSDLAVNSGWRALTGSETYHSEASSMIGALVTAAPDQAYVSPYYTLSYLTNVTPEEYTTQNLMLVQIIPEPGVALLAAFPAFFAFLRRRR